MKRLLSLRLFGVFPLILLIGTPLLARTCSLQGVAGNYGYTTTGTVPTVGAVAALGRISLTEDGNLTGAQTTSFNGTLVQETLSGTYTVDPNCTGTATVNVYHSGVLARTTNLAVIFDSNERELRAIFLTPGTVLTIQGRKLFSDED